MTSRPSPPDGRLDATAVATVTILCLVWGFNQVSIKFALEGISPILQGGLRSAGSLVLLCLWAAARGTPLLSRDRSLWLGLALGALFATEFLFVYLAVAWTSASRVVVFLYTAPFFVALGAHVVLPGERLRTGPVLGLLAAFLGLVLAFADGVGGAAGSLAGDLTAVLGAMFWGATTLLVKGSRLVRLSADKVLLYQLAVSALLLPLASLATGEAGIVMLNARVLGGLAFQIVVVSFASYLAWFWLIGRNSATKLSAFTFLTPLFGVAAGAVILGEPVSPLFGVAMALVCAGLWLVNRPHAGPANR